MLAGGAAVLATSGGWLGGAGAAVAVLVAGGVVWVALSLPGTTPQGLLLGAGIPLMAMMSWTKPHHPIGLWLVTATVTVAAVVWTYPWWRQWREVVRLGGFWLPVTLWIAGALSALLLGRVAVLGGRVAYGCLAVVMTLLVFQTVRGRGRDVSIGIAAGMMICHGLLLALGAEYVFDSGVHHVPDDAWGRGQTDRFWGGPWLTYHPNLIAMTAVLVAIRVGADTTLAPWQRWAAVGNGALLLSIADSRTSLLMAGVASAAYGLLHVWRTGLPRLRRFGSRRAFGHALIPVAVTLMVFTAVGGAGNLLKDRYQDHEPRREVTRPLSGRVGIWEMMLSDFRADTVVEQLLGNTDSARGDILRHRDPNHPKYQTQPRLAGHNVFVGALRRGGVVGLLAVVVSLGLVVWRTVRRTGPVWVPVVTLAALTTLITEDEWVVTGPLWLMVFAGEVWTYAHVSRPPRGCQLPGAPITPARTVGPMVIQQPAGADGSGVRRGCVPPAPGGPPLAAARPPAVQPTTHRS